MMRWRRIRGIHRLITLEYSFMTRPIVGDRSPLYTYLLDILLSDSIMIPKCEGGGKMKALVGICVWILFIYGCVMLINMIIQSWFFALSEEMTMISGGIAMTSFFLTVVAAKIKSNL